MQTGFLRETANKHHKKTWILPGWNANHPTHISYPRYSHKHSDPAIVKGFTGEWKRENRQDHIVAAKVLRADPECYCSVKVHLRNLIFYLAKSCVATRLQTSWNPQKWTLLKIYCGTHWTVIHSVPQTHFNTVISVYAGLHLPDMTEDQFMHRVMLFAVLVQKDWRLADSTNQVRRKHKRRSV